MNNKESLNRNIKENINLYKKNIEKINFLIKNKEENINEIINILKDNSKLYLKLFYTLTNEANINFYKSIFKEDADFFEEVIENYLNSIIKKDNVKKFNELKSLIVSNKLNKKRYKNEKNKLDKKKIFEAFKILGDEYYKIFLSIINSNSIEERKNISQNYFIWNKEGKIVINDINKISSLAHEMGHFLRYRLAKKVNKNILVEEIFAIVNELILLDYISNNKVKLNKEIIYNELNMLLSKIFDTTEATLLQIYTIANFKNENTININDIKNKREELLIKLGYISNKKEDKNKEYKLLVFGQNAGYLRPLYPVTYSISVFLAFDILEKLKSDNINIRKKYISLLKKEEISVNDIFDLIELNKEKYFEEENIQNKLKNILEYINNCIIYNE